MTNFFSELKNLGLESANLDMIAVQAADILWKMFRYKFLTISGSVLNLEKLNSKGFSLSL